MEFKHSTLVSVEDLFQLQDGSKVRTLGFIKKDDRGKFVIEGLSGAQVNLDMTANIINPNPALSYLIIGDYRQSTIFCQIVREVRFSKYNLSFFLKNIPYYQNINYKSVNVDE